MNHICHRRWETPEKHGESIVTSNTEGLGSVLKIGHVHVHVKVGGSPTKNEGFIGKYLSVWCRSFGIVTGFSLAAENRFYRDGR